MIAALSGAVATVGIDHVVVDVGGVGYLVHVAPGSVRARDGDTVSLHTHMVVREDAMTLYGFAEASGRDMFTTLLGITGVGPKVALATIGTLGTDGLRRAVLAEDVAALTAVPGVGKKGAARMLLELRERVGAPDDAAGPVGPGAPADPITEAREALIALGFGPAEAHTALEAVGPPPDEGAQVADLVAAALRSLGAKR